MGQPLEVTQATTELEHNQLVVCARPDACYRLGRLGAEASASREQVRFDRSSTMDRAEPAGNLVPVDAGARGNESCVHGRGVRLMAIWADGARLTGAGWPGEPC